MFTASRWAQAFWAACKDEKEEGLAVLAAYAAAWPHLGHGILAAQRPEKALRAVTGGAPGRGALAAARAAALLVRKGLARHIPAVLNAAEKIHDDESKIVSVNLDSAQPLDETFLDALRARLREYTAAGEVRINQIVNKDLIAGCRLHIGSDCIDASLRGRLQNMAADLRASGGYSWQISQT